MTLLEKIKQKPDHQKRVISVVTAGALTILIVGLWFSLGRKDSSAAPEQAEATLSSISPLQVIKDEFSKAIDNFKETVSDGSTSSPQADSGQATSSLEVEIKEQ